jgi:hypothetical protein
MFVEVCMSVLELLLLFFGLIAKLLCFFLGYSLFLPFLGLNDAFLGLGFKCS